MLERKAKTVSRRFALNEFRTIGLVLILYSLLVLLLPQLIKELLKIRNILTFHNIDLLVLTDLLCLLFGTFFPFFILRIATRKTFSSFGKSADIGLGDVLCDSLVFFALVSAAIFVMTALGAYFNIPGEVVSGIGVTINVDNLDNILYILCFCLVSPLVEEYAFRGVLLKCLSRYGKYFALYTSAFIYSLAHGSFIEMFPSFVMAVILGKISLCYKSIEPCVFIHIIFNAILYALFRIPDAYVSYMSYFLALVYIVAIVLIVTKVYVRIKVKRPANVIQVFLLFISNFFVDCALAFFIAHSVLLWIL